ncbi:hypothetical protein PQE75_gp026 [Bacillus phage vB_BcoS-136]|uniref:Uncharacterized protein n=1 Tax=Bacillus phage vB_BcoS-136 TaxID=2419619 RepID=A0A3G3BV97_9CAUD|nr:hypothetical protein PQE75_gp026 [Bacillus phage vB_BcoS-136]AYP68158.1 hypothetical protein vBBcoS136_00026 [Bacillus phage vB_BcoS-136]
MDKDKLLKELQRRIDESVENCEEEVEDALVSLLWWIKNNG